ncbi:phenylacetate--CoA ligase family protein [Metallosphaera hakonensis]|uniref:Phenylacetate--CoA ligase n=1 Tax=Metallosphaera hakonensis JCM 8857 = DSM 7519 TaxID=1293036 RepID=A0A2U9ISX0_9CREN|nr:phenylacetate--CoA ligase [Metallosphaera hakonensis]AWR99053.1 AMP-binding protein [Metallosphaera hakonensis JCM 8857 = DSM 7519]
MMYDETDPRALSKEDIESVQMFRLRRVIRRVYESSPFYRKVFKERNLTPEDIRSKEDLKRIPFTTKGDLREKGYPYGGEFLTVSLEEIVGWHMTSGTTGVPTVGAYTSSDVELWANLVARSLRTAGVTRKDVIANVYGYGLFTGGMGLHLGAQKLGAKVIPWSTGRTEALAKTLKDFRATVITGTPSYELVIAEKVREAGLDPEKDLDLRLAIPGAEAMTPEMLRRIEKEFGLLRKGGGAREIYGLTEAIGPGVAQECPEDNHEFMHIWTDHFLVEIVDPETGENLEEGEEGEMVLTHLTREGMPLLRYRTRDITKLVESDDNIPYPKVAIMKGRSDDVIFYKGVKLYPTAVNEVLMSFPEVMEYQMVITKEPQKFLLLVETTSPSEDLRRKIITDIKNTTFVNPEVDFVSPGTLPRFEGKAKRVVLK